MNNFLNIIFTSVDYIITDIDQYIGATGSNITITLPTGIFGRFYQIKNQSPGDIQVQGTGGETIEGSVFKILKTNAGFTVVFDGTTWKIL